MVSGAAVGFGALLLAAGIAAAGQEAAGQWRAAGRLSVGRYAPGAALLADGRVLVAGGYSFETQRTHATSELFDPAAEAWSDGPSMRFDRNFPAVLSLPEGAYLFLAGYRNRVGTTATTELLGRDGRFVPGEPALEERELHAAVRLADGRFLITGGYSTLRRRTLATAEILDSQGRRPTSTAGAMRHARFGHDSVLLPDGRVLIVGGKVLATNADVLPAELFDPPTGTFTETGALVVGRDRCTAWLLPDRRRVLVAGGSADEGGTPPARRCEVYTLADGRFAMGPELLRDRMAHTATSLAAARVLLVGGWSGSEGRTTRQAELWDPQVEKFVDAGQLQVGRHDHAAVRLSDGRVLIVGGKEAPARGGAETPLEAELWEPPR